MELLQRLEEIEIVPGLCILLGLAGAVLFSFRSRRRQTEPGSRATSPLLYAGAALKGLLCYIVSGIVLTVTAVCAVAALRNSTLTGYFERFGAIGLIFFNGALYGGLIIISSFKTIPKQTKKKK